eukprot:Gb_39585 [translate_table: standard]
MVPEHTFVLYLLQVLKWPKFPSIVVVRLTPLHECLSKNLAIVKSIGGAMGALRQTVAVAEDGAHSLYKGMGDLLVTVATLNVVLFIVRGQMEVWIAPFQIKSMRRFDILQQKKGIVQRRDCLESNLVSKKLKKEKGRLHITRVEARKRSSKKKRKEGMIIGKSSRDNSFPGKVLDAEGKGFIDGPISDDKHLSNTSKPLDREVIDSSNEAWVAHASLPCAKDNLLSIIDVGGIEVSVATITTHKFKIVSSTEMGNVTLNDRDLSDSVDHPDYDPMLPTLKEGQETINNLGYALENASMNLVESVPLSYHSIGLSINKATVHEEALFQNALRDKLQSQVLQVDEQEEGRGN